MRYKRFSSPVAVALTLCSGMWASDAAGQADDVVLADEKFEADLSAWNLVNADSIEIVPDPGAPGNHVLQLTPEKGEYTHATYGAGEEWSNIRIEGRFLFPTEGDGYLGFIYHSQERNGRKDFGCIYVKSNGNYIRVSPHHDGNPSWRLYEELKVPLTGAQRIEVGAWYPFRLDVAGQRASLYLVDMETPIRTFDWLQDHGAFGLEARPGGGAPVWVDDLRVTRLDESGDPGLPPGVAEQSDELLTSWEIQGPFDEAEGQAMQVGSDHLGATGWREKPTDERGAVIAALDFDSNASARHVVYLRTRFSSPDAATRQLALSTVNALRVWLNGDLVGEVEPESYIWSDFLSNPEHAGARFEIHPQPSQNEVIIRLDGDRFAGGGFFAALSPP